jgi:hypothetical protein
MDEDWNPERIVNDKHSLVRDCAHLLSTTTLQSESDTVAVELVHFSLHSFLTANPELFYSTFPRYHVYPLPAAHFSIATSCIKYFKLHSADHNAYPDAFASNRWRAGFDSYARLYWPVHTSDSGRAAELLGDIFQTTVQSASAPPIVVFPDVTSVRAINCTFVAVHQDLYSIYSDSVSPDTWIGKFSMQDMFPNLTNVEVVNPFSEFLNCDFHESGTQLTIYHGPMRGECLVEFLGTNHVDITNFVFTHVGGTRYEIYPASRRIVADHTHSDASICENYRNVHVSGGVFDTGFGNGVRRATSGPITYSFKPGRRGDTGD